MISKVKLIICWERDVTADGYFVMQEKDRRLVELVRIENINITSVFVSELQTYTEHHFVICYYVKKNNQCEIYKSEDYYGYVDEKKFSVYRFPIPKFKEATKKNNMNFLEWESVAEEIHYLVARKTLKGKWERLEITKNVYYVDKDIDTKTKYIYTVRCISEDGKVMLSSFSNKGITL